MWTEFENFIWMSSVVQRDNTCICQTDGYSYGHKPSVVSLFLPYLNVWRRLYADHCGSEWVFLCPFRESWVSGSDTTCFAALSAVNMRAECFFCLVRVSLIMLVTQRSYLESNEVRGCTVCWNTSVSTQNKLWELILLKQAQHKLNTLINISYSRNILKVEQFYLLTTCDAGIKIHQHIGICWTINIILRIEMELKFYKFMAGSKFYMERIVG
jgi:hypothetical protein